MTFTLFLSIAVFTLTFINLVYHLYLLKDAISYKDSSFIIMLTGTMIGLCSGTLIGLNEKHLLLAFVYASCLGGVIGWTSGLPLKTSICLKGFLSGLLSSAMGVILTTLLPQNQIEMMVQLLLILFVCLSFFMIFVLTHIHQKATQLTNLPITFFLGLALFFITYNQLGPLLPTKTAGATEFNVTPKTITITASEYHFIPKVIKTKKGQPIQLILYNMGQQEHHLFLKLPKQNIILMTQPNMNQTIRFTPSKKGTYLFYCNMPGHKAMGMKGKLIVK